VAARLATIEAYGLPRDWWERFPVAVEAVTAADVAEVAREHFDPERLVRVVVGNGIGDRLQGTGDSGTDPPTS
jgi:predicted Zn-dependent peptidase